MYVEYSFKFFDKMVDKLIPYSDIPEFVFGGLDFFWLRHKLFKCILK